MVGVRRTAATAIVATRENVAMVYGSLDLILDLANLASKVSF